MLEQTLLFGRPEKNNISFDLTPGELLRFLALSFYEAITVFWSNQPDL